MHVAKITNKFYRVYSNGKSKDVMLDGFGGILEPVNPFNILTETEKQRVEVEIKKEMKHDTRGKIK